MPALPDESKLLRNFSRCQDWEERYLYMIELGGVYLNSLRYKEAIII